MKYLSIIYIFFITISTFATENKIKIYTKPIGSHYSFILGTDAFIGQAKDEVYSEDLVEYEGFDFDSNTLSFNLLKISKGQELILSLNPFLCLKPDLNIQIYSLLIYEDSKIVFNCQKKHNNHNLEFSKKYGSIKPIIQLTRVLWDIYTTPRDHYNVLTGISASTGDDQEKQPEYGLEGFPGGPGKNGNNAADFPRLHIMTGADYIGENSQIVFKGIDGQAGGEGGRGGIGGGYRGPDDVRKAGDGGVGGPGGLGGEGGNIGPIHIDYINTKEGCDFGKCQITLIPGKGGKGGKGGRGGPGHPGKKFWDFLNYEVYHGGKEGKVGQDGKNGNDGVIKGIVNTKNNMP